MIKLKNILSETYVWDRKFGESLPTLSDVMEKHGDCDCGDGGGDVDANELWVLLKITGVADAHGSGLQATGDFTLY